MNHVIVPNPIDRHGGIQKQHCVIGNIKLQIFIIKNLCCSVYLREEHWFLGGSPFLGYGKLNKQADVGFRRLSCCCRVCMSNTQEICLLQNLIGKVCKQTKVLPATDANDNAVIERYVILSFNLHFLLFMFFNSLFFKDSRVA